MPQAALYEDVCNASGQNPHVCDCRSVPRCGRVAARLVSEAEVAGYQGERRRSDRCADLLGRSHGARRRGDLPRPRRAGDRSEEKNRGPRRNRGLLPTGHGLRGQRRPGAGLAGPRTGARPARGTLTTIGERRRGYLLFGPAFFADRFLPRLLTRLKIARSFLTSFAVRLAANADGNPTVWLPTFTSSRAVAAAGAAFADFDDFATFDAFAAFRGARLAALRPGAAVGAGAAFLRGRRVAFRDGAATGSSSISSSAGDRVERCRTRGTSLAN